MPRFVGIDLFLFGPDLNFGAFFRNICGNVFFDKFSALSMGVKEGKRVFAGKLAAGAGAAEDGF